MSRFVATRGHTCNMPNVQNWAVWHFLKTWFKKKNQSGPKLGRSTLTLFNKQRKYFDRYVYCSYFSLHARKTLWFSKRFRGGGACPPTSMTLWVRCSSPFSTSLYLILIFHIYPLLGPSWGGLSIPQQLMNPTMRTVQSYVLLLSQLLVGLENEVSSHYFSHSSRCGADSHCLTL